MAQFTLFLYDDPTQFAELSPEDMQQIIEKYRVWGQSLSEADRMVASNKLIDGEGRVLSGAGLAALETLDSRDDLRGYHLLPATRADFLTRLGRHQEAAESYRAALECPCSEPERQFLLARLNVLLATD